MADPTELSVHGSPHLLLGLVRQLCASFIPHDHENFDKICLYSLDLISRKKVPIENCEEQYILSKIRHSFFKESKPQESILFEDLYHKLKMSSYNSACVGDLLYLLFLLSESNSASKQELPFLNIPSNVEKLKLFNAESSLGNDILPSNKHNNPHRQAAEIAMRKTTHGIVRPHTVHGELDNNYLLTSKYSLLAKDLIFIFQGLSGKHINFNHNEKVLFTMERTDLFAANDIFFAKRLSVLGQYFKSIKMYSASAMSNSSKGFVCQSFGSALDEQINHFYKLITNILSNYHSKHSEVTLLKLNLWTYETAIRFEALSSLITKCRAKKGGALISVVYDLLRNGDPIVRQSIRTILSKVLKPIRSMLNHWIFYGELKDEYKEFFICVNENSHTSAGNDFWQDKYSINKAMLPGFISKEQAYKILITGKAISMLREVSLNKVTIILPAYDQLKQSFENSNLETLFEKRNYTNPNDFAGLLEYVYKEISQTALSILNAKYTLHGHFLAYKRYLLFEQGDFVNYLMELLYPIINRPASKLKLFTLSQTLETAIRKTNAQYDSPEVLHRIDIFLEQSLQHENGWNIFTLKYRIDGPISTIFNEQSQVMYSKIFTLFWKIKRVNFSLNHCWINLKLALRQYGKLATNLCTISNHFCFIMYQIRSFVATVERYFNYLLEKRWSHVQHELDHPRNLDKLVKAHQVFLQNFVKELFFDNSNNLTYQFAIIVEQTFCFVEKLEGFIGEFTSLDKHAWNDTNSQDLLEIDANYNMWLLNFSKMFNKEIALFLEMLVETEEDRLQELCFSIDFNKYYKCHVLVMSEQSL